MYYYTYTLTNLDFLYFATREVAQRAIFTKDVIHNYALMYALNSHFRITSPHSGTSRKIVPTPKYKELKDPSTRFYIPFHISPAKLTKTTSLISHFFNSVGTTISYAIEEDRDKKLNFPRIGSYQKISPLAEYTGVLSSPEPLPKTLIIRLGKKKAPCRITFTSLSGSLRSIKTPVNIENAVNPNDIIANPKSLPSYSEKSMIQIHSGNFVMIPPSPVLTNIRASGYLFESNDKYFIFPVEQLSNIPLPTP